MPLGRPIPAVRLDDRMREHLQGMTRSRSLPQGLAQRAQINLLAADGLNNRPSPLSWDCPAPPWANGAGAS